MSMNDAFNLVKEARPIIAPNLIFMSQLMDYESAIPVCSSASKINSSEKNNNNNDESSSNRDKMNRCTTAKVHTSLTETAFSKLNRSSVTCPSLTTSASTSKLNYNYEIKKNSNSESSSSNQLFSYKEPSSPDSSSNESSQSNSPSLNLNGNEYKLGNRNSEVLVYN
jgi:hypothetical protein